MNVVCVGDCGIDLYEPDGRVRPGGITTNFAIQARHRFPTGTTVRIIAPLGNDDAATVVRQHLEGKDIDCHFAVLDGSTPVQHIEIDSSGERHFVGYEEGVLREFRVAEQHTSFIEHADLLVAPVFEQNRKMFASIMAVSFEGITAVDFADFALHPNFDLLQNYADRIDVAFFGLRTSHADIMARLQSTAASHNITIVVTLGADGSCVFQGANTHLCDAPPVDPIVDTTGAGDAYAAGFLGVYCLSSDIEKSMAAGAAAAVGVIQKQGGS